jgi:predicted O-methyltransferase YrrM
LNTGKTKYIMPKYTNRSLYPEVGFTWKHLLGFFTWPLLYQDMVKRFPSGSCFVEVGVFEGRSLGFLIAKTIEAGKDIKITGVDHFKGQSNNLAWKVRDNLGLVSDKYTLIEDTSVNASKLFKDKSVDFVFIDAGHDYDDIKSDITAWLPKVKKGGIIAGHDYYYPDVMRAVSETFKVDLKYESENCWLYVSD